MKNYIYVFFDAAVCRDGHVDDTNYFYISTSDLRDDPDIEMVYYPLDYAPNILRKMCNLCTKLCNKSTIFYPLKRFWFPFYFKRKIKKNQKVCFIVYGYYIKPDYLRYLKRKFKNCKIIKLHRDSYLNWKRKNPEFSDADINELFDFHFSFDLQDSEKYHMVHFNEFASYYNVNLDVASRRQDVFFAGAAKDRMNTLIAIYDYLTNLGLKCFFFITNCELDNRVERPGIVYSEQTMPYPQMLSNTINSNIILEINQGNVDGYTSRFLESVMYNKKLITNNASVKMNSFYNPNYIMCFKTISDITSDFLFRNVEIDYHYNGEFSPKHLIDYIDVYLNNKQYE